MNIIPNYDSNRHLLKLVSPQCMRKVVVFFFFVSVSVTTLDCVWILQFSDAHTRNLSRSEDSNRTMAQNC